MIHLYILLLWSLQTPCIITKQNQEGSEHTQKLQLCDGFILHLALMRKTIYVTCTDGRQNVMVIHFILPWYKYFSNVFSYFIPFFYQEIKDRYTIYAIIFMELFAKRMITIRYIVYRIIAFSQLCPLENLISDLCNLSQTSPFSQRESEAHTGNGVQLIFLFYRCGL